MQIVQLLCEAKSPINLKDVVSTFNISTLSFFFSDTMEVIDTEWRPQVCSKYFLSFGISRSCLFEESVHTCKLFSQIYLLTPSLFTFKCITFLLVSIFFILSVGC